MRSGLGVGWMAASTVLQESLHAKPPTLKQQDPHTLAARHPHFPARAKAVIHIFANGGPSHIDTFDPKPKLEEYAGREIPGALKRSVEQEQRCRHRFSFDNMVKVDCR